MDGNNKYTEQISDFICSPSRNHLIIANGCLDDLEYVNVGLEVSTLIEDKLNDRRLSMRIQDDLNNIMNCHICHSEKFGYYIGLKNIGILFEPLLKINLEGFFDRWSQNITLIINKDKAIIDNNRLFLTKGCSNDYTVSLKGINYIEFEL